MLAGIVNKPSRLAPTRHLAAARARAEVVLSAMVHAGWLTREEAAATPAAELSPGRTTIPVGAYFADWVGTGVKDQLSPGYGEVAVPTTLDATLQAHAEAVVTRVLARRADQGRASQAALVAMRPRDCLPWCSRDYSQSQFNRAFSAATARVHLQLSLPRCLARGQVHTRSPRIAPHDKLWSPKTSMVATMVDDARICVPSRTMSWRVTVRTGWAGSGIAPRATLAPRRP